MRRGQVTMFVAIGIVLLLIIGLFLLAPRNNSPSSLAAQEEASVVTNYVQQCLAQASEQSIQLLGTQGGYASLSTLRDTPTQDTQVVSTDLQKVPYWHEVGRCADPDGCVADNRPALCTARPCPGGDVGPRSIQAGIESLAASRVMSCLGNFSTFPQLQVTAGSPKVVATIREEEVALAMQLPLTLVTSDGQTVHLNEFSSAVPIRLPLIYRMAKSIQSLERQNTFLEEIFLHLLSIYSDVDGPLPPLRDVQISGPEHQWSRSRVQQTIEADLLPYMNIIQVPNAELSYAPLQGSERNASYAQYSDGIYEYMTVDLGAESYPLGARFEYPNTPMYLDINGREFLRPRTLADPGQLLSFLRLSLRDYRFRYTAAFPVVVTVSDPEAFSGRGFELSFAMEANVKNNHALNVSANILTSSSGQSTLDLSAESQHVDHTYAVKVIDRRTNRPMPGAQIISACGTEYLLGETDAQGLWRGKMPFCLGGAIVADIPGYVRASVNQTNVDEDGATSSVSLALWPLVSKKITVYKITSVDVAAYAQRRMTRTRLSPNDSLTLQMLRVKDSEFEEDVPYTPALSFGGASLDTMFAENVVDTRQQLTAALEDGQITQQEYDAIIAELDAAPATPGVRNATVSETAVVDLAPGRYELDGILMYNGNITIPRKCALSILGVCARWIDAQNLPSWQSGGVLLLGGNATTLRPEDIYSNKSIVIFALEQPIPTSWEMLEAHQDLAMYQTYDRRTLVQPKVE